MFIGRLGFCLCPHLPEKPRAPDVDLHELPSDTTGANPAALTLAPPTKSHFGTCGEDLHSFSWPLDMSIDILYDMRDEQSSSK